MVLSPSPNVWVILLLALAVLPLESAAFVARPTDGGLRRCRGSLQAFGGEIREASQRDAPRLVDFILWNDGMDPNRTGCQRK
jgi:hypothetical protein